MHVSGSAYDDSPGESVEPGSIETADVRAASDPETEPPSKEEARLRLAHAASESFDFIWRSLRRLGVRPDAAVDDAVQRVFEIAARKTNDLQAGMERAFLLKTAVLVAAEERRRQQQTTERVASAEPGDLESPGLDPERALAARRERQLLDELLDELPEKLRTVFVLFELEGLTSAEIANLLSVPVGTAASRLRLARQHFQDGARRLRARQSWSNP
ncbi:MAG TPA: sigma-70 family RNA polymerase sigma factor [Polyangiaceae bacterium]|nr:sigma-70 family RNA polymerase sigma factor [Polyangiaceae bacterium]